MGGRNNKGLFGWVAVFAAGFVIGYGLMSFAVEVPAPPAQAPPAEIAEATPAPAPVAAPSEKAAPAPAKAQEGAPTGATPDEPTKAPTPPEAAPADPPAPAPAPEAAAAPPKPKTWWEKCRGKTCAVDFGVLTGGVSLRRGHVMHGTTVDWDRDYGTAERIGVLRVARDRLIEVKGVALDAEGRPAAAEVKFTDAGKTMTGVISLRPGDKTIRFVPSEP